MHTLVQTIDSLVDWWHLGQGHSRHQRPYQHQGDSHHNNLIIKALLPDYRHRQRRKTVGLTLLRGNGCAILGDPQPTRRNNREFLNLFTFANVTRKPDRRAITCAQRWYNARPRGMPDPFQRPLRGCVQVEIRHERHPAHFLTELHL